MRGGRRRSILYVKQTSRATVSLVRHRSPSGGSEVTFEKPYFANPRMTRNCKSACGHQFVSDNNRLLRRLHRTQLATHEVTCTISGLRPYGLCMSRMFSPVNILSILVFASRSRNHSLHSSWPQPVTVGTRVEAKEGSPQSTCI